MFINEWPAWSSRCDLQCSGDEEEAWEETELSGLMNPCRGAAVGLDYYHKGQTHKPERDTHTHTHTHTHTGRLTLKHLFVYFQQQTESMKYLKHFKGSIIFVSHLVESGLKINISLHEGNKTFLFVTDRVQHNGG